MRYTRETGAYNERRYGKPWIARLNFSKPGKPVYEFGDWLGQPGNEGELTIEVQPGDVLARGQEDYRKNRGGADEVGVILADGSCDWGYTLAEARDTGKALREKLAEEASHPESAPEIFDPCL